MDEETYLERSINYWLTTKKWAERLEANRDHIVQHAGDATFRKFRLLIWACAAMFDLKAVPFDLDRLQVSGQAARLAEAVRVSGERAHYAVSDVGELVYLPGSPQR